MRKIKIKSKNNPRYIAVQELLWFGDKPQIVWSPGSTRPGAAKLELNPQKQFNPLDWVKDLLSRPKTAREVDAPVETPKA